VCGKEDLKKKREEKGTGEADMMRKEGMSKEAGLLPDPIHSNSHQSSQLTLLRAHCVPGALAHLIFTNGKQRHREAKGPRSPIAS
jgi:hypothetical protein